MTTNLINEARKIGSALRLNAAIGGAKVTSKALRYSGRGGGTAAPGLVATTLDPNLVAKMAKDLDEGVIVVAGTNGKTTTARLVYDTLVEDGRAVVHNRSGSNLVRGVASAFATQSSMTGQLLGSLAVVEADEAAFPEIVDQTKPAVVLLINLFRDQLDRYGELDAIAQKWAPALASLPKDATIVFNADDPRLVALAEQSPSRKLPFGIEPGSYQLAALPHAADVAVCNHCGADLMYHSHSSSHLGDWYCAECGWKRPEPLVAGREIQLCGTESLTLLLSRKSKPDCTLHVAVPGLYNAYNLVAAAAAATAAEVHDHALVAASEHFVAPFGRIQQVQLRARSVKLVLVKNPVGFNEVLRMLTSSSNDLAHPTMIVINDLDADGKDVSWLWDVDFELLSSGEHRLATAGIRGADMANRLKYAGVEAQRIDYISGDLRSAFYRFVDTFPVETSGYVLATYTAMMELHRGLAEDGLAPAFWEQ